MRHIISGWFTSHLEEVETEIGPLCRIIDSELSRVVEASMGLVVVLVGDETYTVKSTTNSCVVDLENRLCDCGVFQADMILCAHAAAAIRFAKYDVNSFVGECYLLERVKGMWGGLALYVPDPSEWQSLGLHGDDVCNPPDCPKQAGRPKRSRIKSAKEKHFKKLRTQRCSRFSDSGHNRSTYTSHRLIKSNSTTNM